jgi:hypothetical protein
MNRFLACILAVPVLSCTVYAQNGIDVGRAKAFDNRTLTLMLDRLNTQLKGLQVVDQKSLTTALGTLQGFSSQESSSSLSVQAAAPGSKAAPTPTDSTAFNTFSPPTDVKYGLNAGDLLNDQVNLTYQIFNLQMIIDRSMSDRLKGKDPKLQVVLGFDVTLDPPRDAVDSAAIVEVAVRMKDSQDPTKFSQDPVSVVALMPQEHTYNAAALRTKSSAFGGSAVAQIATVAYSSRRRSQTYFLYRDSDTVAFERSLGVRTSQSSSKKGKDGADPSPETRFGWQFRPVLGRRSVSPGSRQMFAVLALPATDKPDDSRKSECLDIQVTTHWRKYDRSTLTSSEIKQMPWWSEVRYALGLGIPFVYSPLGWGGGSRYDLEVPKMVSIQQNLSPVVEHVSWSLLGSKQLLVSVTGKNFFNDTQAALGGKVLGGSALQIKSEQALDLLVEPAEPFSGALIGRYGSAVPLINPGSASLAIGISDVRVSGVIGGVAEVNVFLVRKGGGRLTTADLPHTVDTPPRLLEPVFTFNGAVIAGPWTYTDVTGKVLATAYVSADALKSGEGMFVVTYPFSDVGLRASFPINDPNKLIEAQRLADSVLLISKLPNLIPWSTDWSAILAGNKIEAAAPCPAPAAGAPPPPAPPFCFQSKQYAFLALPAKDSSDRLLLYESKYGGTYLVTIPAKPASTQPAASTPPPINQYDSRWVKLDAKSVTKPFVKAQLDGKDVDVSTDPAGPPYNPPFNTVEVFVTRAFSEKPGTLEVNFLDDKGKVVDRATIVINCTGCQTTTDNKEAKK